MSLVSVVTVCYNAVSSIERTILSVINQNFSDIEYIIIDGGSSDGTIDLIKKYNKYISLWISEPDLGIYDAMNKGIIKSTSQWLIFMNAGDVFYNNSTINSITDLLENNNIDILYGNILKVYSKHRIVKSRGIGKSNPSLIDFYTNTINHQSAFIRNTMFEKNGLYSLDYKLASDWYFFLQASMNNANIVYIDKNISRFMMDGQSTIHLDKYIEEENTIKKKLFGNYHEYFNEVALYRNSRIIRIAIKLQNCLNILKETESYKKTSILVKSILFRK